MVEYNGLWKILKQKGIKKSDLVELAGISSRTISKISKGEKVADNVIRRLGEYLGCKREDICREVSDNAILQTLRDEKEARISGGLYHETQIRLTYNSNRIEGSKLSEDQTRLIFETNTIGASEGVPIDDIIETANHFRAVEYLIDCAEQELTEEIIKTFHKILKTGTRDSYLAWFNVGEYKKRANVVGGMETTAPSRVGEEMKRLLKEYNSKQKIGLEDIVELHYRFEKIHPFQDGNGRVGRLVCFKECLRFNIMPFIIDDSKKVYYYRGLKEWENERIYLLETCRAAQDEYKELTKIFAQHTRN